MEQGDGKSLFTVDRTMLYAETESLQSLAETHFDIAETLQSLAETHFDTAETT